MGSRLRAACAVFAVAGASAALVLAGPAIGADRAFAAEAAERPAALRFANLTDDGGSIDLLLDGRLRVVAMVGGRTTDFMVVPAGRHTIGVRGDASPDAAAALIVAPGASPTVLLLGRSSHPSAFTLPDVADSAPSIRVVNTSATRVHVGIADDGFDIDAGSSHLAPVHAGLVDVEAAATGGLGDVSSAPQTATVRQTFTVRPTASMVAIVTGSPALLVIHAIAPHALAPDALALQADDQPPVGVVRSMFRHDGVWLRRILAGIVIVLVFAATLSSLAVFRVESLEDRVRNRMR